MVRIENDPAARMKVLSRGELMAPADCCVCGSSTHDLGYLDIGVFYDYEGQQYLCMTCAYQAGETVGLFTPEEVKHLQQLSHALAEKVAEQEKELAHARPVIAALRSVGPGVIDTLIGSDLDSSEDVEEQHGVGYRRSDDTVSGANGRESVTSESTTGTGRSDADQFELQYSTPEQPTLD